MTSRRSGTDSNADRISPARRAKLSNLGVYGLVLSVISDPPSFKNMVSVTAPILPPRMNKAHTPMHTHLHRGVTVS